jgi:nitrogen fixation NifU-like protein
MDVRELYQEIILDHNRSPRNFRVIEGADCDAEGYNPLCGDQYHIYLKTDGDRIDDISFQGRGCAISKASASLMTALLKGRTRAEAEAAFQTLHELVTRSDLQPDVEAVGKLAVFAGVRDYPTRVKCATLAWHAMRAALRKQAGAATTE